MNNFEDNTGNMREGSVTFLDILGWKGIWQRKSDALQTLLKLTNKIKLEAERIPKLDKFGGGANIFKDLKVDVKSISDTIVLITYGDCDITLEFHAGISGAIIAKSILNQIPIRGATCYGYFTTEGNVMVGPAIDEVASWFEMGDWIGVFQTPSAMYKSSQKYLFDKYKVLNIYSVPLKKGTFETYCVDWTHSWLLNKKNEKELLDCFISMGPITPDIALKFTNTLTFYRTKSVNSPYFT